VAAYSSTPVRRPRRASCSAFRSAPPLSSANCTSLLLLPTLPRRSLSPQSLLYAPSQLFSVARATHCASRCPVQTETISQRPRQLVGDEASPTDCLSFTLAANCTSRRHICSLSPSHATPYHYVFRREDAVLCGRSPRPGAASATHCESRGAQVCARAGLLSPCCVHCVCRVPFNEAL
jgi:hypothetical protein